MNFPSVDDGLAAGLLGLLGKRLCGFILPDGPMIVVHNLFHAVYKQILGRLFLSHLVRKSEYPGELLIRILPEEFAYLRELSQRERCAAVIKHPINA